MRVGDIIRQLRKERKMTQGELARKLGVAPTAVSAWERNENRPLMDKLSIIADIFEVPLTRFFESEEFGGNTSSDMIRLPIVGRISCGNGILAFEDVSGYEPTPTEWLNGGEYFYLRAQGDSMSGARIYEGDLLLIRKQPEVENGEIAVVLIGEEAVLKRVYRNGDQLVLQSENPNYPPIFAPPTEAKVIGKLKMNVIKY
ncbi:helix-turn-helix domain-containing protein [Paenibacillus alvei]|uniref:LexA family protein n=1 Tax=Paenibacillus alvei TaxID=44250 RepID=UPI00028A01D5|nr:XRE family transcriptional regulator [Paenibacillus alvei]EJW14132.1 SOS-response transcriptional repressor LexA (HTH, RecA-mediated autopeptidase) [Paenibacillus alvei DSM 29]MCY7486376.1 helix-turn-helix domain-containing protein [Paenibacillus alvei]MCY9544870.1 helix-turn-helix domain-containing protein [Paenibacillus alvei]MCY9708015.1 helix-turn-helix domain-containing protein [Paenibacillus alvei]MCY9736251.1 helix-turn-helix domain-containing protein [Paenibacillus alvei]